MIEGTAGYVRVASTGDVPDGEARIYEVDGEPIALCNVGGRFYAIQNLCTHDDGPLGEGKLLDHVIECPRHGARFDITTGAAVRMPAIAPIRSFRVRIEGTDVYVKIEED